MDSITETFRGARVFVTGHTGFKGSWLCEWLLALGADVFGYGLEPPTKPALFSQLGLERRMRHRIGDVRDLKALEAAVRACAPQFVFHLAAQPLVRLSYEDPVLTYETNVMGTVHVLEALRAVSGPCAAVMVTTDKCYENRERLQGYGEEDALGGHDPYSSSKGAAEIVIAAYRRSFFHPERVFDGAVPRVAVASARAGNVIGGGDWAADRIVPDCIRALSDGKAISVRNPGATRPWQHVLEPLSGYLELAAQMHASLVGVDRGSDARARFARLCSAFNFGPGLASNRSVADLVKEILAHWPGRWEDRSDPGAVHEAALLNLATDKAHHVLGWNPRWDFSESVARTVRWYREAAESASAAAGLTPLQISEYSAVGARRAADPMPATK